MRIVNGTYYQDNTPEKVINALEAIRYNRLNVTIHYGDPATGRASGVKRSGILSRRECSRVKNIITVNGRTAQDISTSLIVKITLTGSDRVFYQHPNYHEPEKG